MGGAATKCQHQSPCFDTRCNACYDPLLRIHGICGGASYFTCRGTLPKNCLPYICTYRVSKKTIWLVRQYVTRLIGDMSTLNCLRLVFFSTKVWNVGWKESYKMSPIRSFAVFKAVCNLGWNSSIFTITVFWSIFWLEVTKTNLRDQIFNVGESWPWTLKCSKKYSSLHCRSWTSVW